MKQSKKFIEEQIGKTVDALNHDRLYSLLSQEVEREMMARNREQFGFRVIDSPPHSGQEIDAEKRVGRSHGHPICWVCIFHIFCRKGPMQTGDLEGGSWAARGGAINGSLRFDPLGRGSVVIHDSPSSI